MWRRDRGFMSEWAPARYRIRMPVLCDSKLRQQSEQYCQQRRQGKRLILWLCYDPIHPGLAYGAFRIDVTTIL